MLETVLEVELVTGCDSEVVQVAGAGLALEGWPEVDQGSETEPGLDVESRAVRAVCSELVLETERVGFSGLDHRAEPESGHRSELDATAAAECWFAGAAAVLE